MQDSIRLSGGVIVLPDGGVLFAEESNLWDVKVHPLGDGHLEASAKRARVWVEGTEDDLTDRQRRQLAMIRNGTPVEPTDAELEERRLMHLRIAANRAKTRVRKLCKVMGASTMLTLTYRANQQDLDLCKTHLRAFVRRCRRFWPTFNAVATFERQERGAWHVHMAMANVPVSFDVRGDGGQICRLRSFNLIRDQWRRVVGDLGGTINVARRKRHSRKTPAQIAAYLSKYITMAFEEGEAHSNRYTRFGGSDIPPAINLGRYADQLQALTDIYTLVDADASIVTAYLSHFKDWFFLAAERVPIKKGVA